VELLAANARCQVASPHLIASHSSGFSHPTCAMEQGFVSLLHCSDAVCRPARVSPGWQACTHAGFCSVEHGIFEAPIAHRGTRQSRLYSIAMPRVGNFPHAVAQHGFRLAKQRGLRFTTHSEHSALRALLLHRHDERAEVVASGLVTAARVRERLGLGALGWDPSTPAATVCSGLDPGPAGKGSTSPRNASRASCFAPSDQHALFAGSAGGCGGTSCWCAPRCASCGRRRTWGTSPTSSSGSTRTCRRP